MAPDISSRPQGEEIPRDPTALVRALLEPLAAGDAERAAAALYAWATPRFRGRVGGEDDLARYLRNPLNAPLVGHRAVRFDPSQRIEGAARLRVVVTADDGERAAYLWSLAHREDEGWRVSGLVREDVALG